MKRTRVGIVGGCPLIHLALKELLKPCDDFRFVAEAETVEGIADMLEEHSLDVTIVYRDAAELWPLETIAKWPGKSRILVVGASADTNVIRQAFDAGADGFILRRSAVPGLGQAVATVAAGNPFIDPSVELQVFSRMISEDAASAAGNPAMLSDREYSVLKKIVLGYSNKTIAEDLGLAVKTVETFKARAMEKLGLKSRAEVVRYAISAGWLS